VPCYCFVSETFIGFFPLDEVTEDKSCITVLHNDFNGSRALLIIPSSSMGVSMNLIHNSKNNSVRHKDHSASLHKTNDDDDDNNNNNNNNINNNNNNNNKWFLWVSGLLCWKVNQAATPCLPGPELVSMETTSEILISRLASVLDAATAWQSLTQDNRPPNSLTFICTDIPQCFSVHCVLLPGGPVCLHNSINPEESLLKK